jgi:hypothetical protein
MIFCFRFLINSGEDRELKNEGGFGREIIPLLYRGGFFGGRG